MVAGDLVQARLTAMCGARAPLFGLTPTCQLSVLEPFLAVGGYVPTLIVVEFSALHPLCIMESFL